MKITYKDVEGVRLNKEQYSFINYNFNKAFPNFPDTFNFNDIVSRYGIRDRRTNLSSSDIMLSIFKQYNAETIDPTKYSYYDLEKILNFRKKNNTLKEGEVFKYQEILKYLKYNLLFDYDNQRLNYVAGATASVNFEKLIKRFDEACLNQKDMSTLLKALTMQINNAVINGLFTGLSNLVSLYYMSAVKNADKTKFCDPVLENIITYLYHDFILGENCISIPALIDSNFDLLITTCRELFTENKKPIEGKSYSVKDLYDIIIFPFYKIFCNYTKRVPADLYTYFNNRK